MPELTRADIADGLCRWAVGSYPVQTAVTFLIGSGTSLNQPWVRRFHDVATMVAYWIDWDLYDEGRGVLSGGEQGTWNLARSLCEGELCENLWRLDPARTEAFSRAIATCRTDWR
jgi:hypothetical protein